MHRPFTLPPLFPGLRSAATALLAACVLQGLAAGGEPQPWDTVVQENGIPYIPMDTLRAFYKFSTDPTRSDRERVTVGYGKFPIELYPGTTRVVIGGYECRLVHPVLKQSNGDLMVSHADVVKLFDPVLRPTYITPRRTVGTVVIDPGHGGADTGVAANGVREADLSLEIALALKEVLVKRGYAVLLTREGNGSVSPQRRIECIRQADAPVFISIHANKGRSDIAGVETYCLQPQRPGAAGRPGNACDTQNIALAFSLHTALVAATGAEDRACRRVRYSFLGSATCPAAIVEVGYPTNKEEASLLASDAYRRQIVNALADGIDTFKNAVRPGAAIPLPVSPADLDADDADASFATKKAEPTKKPAGKR